MNISIAEIQSFISNFDLYELFELNDKFYLELIAYFLGIILIYSGFRIIKELVFKFTNNDSLKSRIGNLMNLAFVFTLIPFSLVLFSKHASTILAISGIFSAALVVALQDFVSSFFAWVFIMSREKYRVGDVIKVAGTHSYIYGKVIKIEIFRTLLEELMGDGDFNGNLNKEMPTGRTVSIPNNIIMRGAVMNFTLENKALWHSFNLTITFTSDFELAEQLIKNVLSGYFNFDYFKKHHIPKNFNPQTTMYIGDNGIIFSIWFPANVGKFRETLDALSRNILLDFKRNRIELAFTTITIENKRN